MAENSNKENEMQKALSQLTKGEHFQTRANGDTFRATSDARDQEPESMCGMYMVRARNLRTEELERVWGNGFKMVTEVDPTFADGPQHLSGFGLV